jgi:sodium/potassium-transporting ATPase subunit alpha
VETLGSVTVICTDKTGTLTRNEMAVKSWGMLGKASAEAEQRLFIAALSCNNTREVGGMLKGDPTEVALFRAARERAGGAKPVRLREFPFDAERKRMSTVNTVDNAVIVMTKGAPESMLPVCDRCMKDGAILAFDETLKHEATALHQSFMDQGLRVLAFSYRIAKPGKFPNKEAAERIWSSPALSVSKTRPPKWLRQLQSAEGGLRIIMITGDARGPPWPSRGRSAS